ncbi:unannotated protein [freshwater metagenome]|uniref:Unannotated protein n=1 Tax=freshwater metagenome TaxID=449393 RepID=A0A6J7L4I7_9ZZZZ
MKRSNGNLESINNLVPPGMRTVISGIPEESSSVVERCAVYSISLCKPASSSISSSWASPNFPRFCEWESAPAIALVCATSDSLWLDIALTWVRISDSASMRRRSASDASFCNFSIADFIASISVASFEPAIALSRSDLYKSRSARTDANSAAETPSFDVRRLAMKFPRARPIKSPITSVRMATTALDMGLSWQEALTMARRLYSL